MAWWEKWNSFCPIFYNCSWENKETDVVVGTVGVKQSHPFLYPPSSSNLDQFHFFFFWIEVLVRLKVEIVTYYIITVHNFKIIAIKLFSKHLLI